jgi:hypothetical protein
VTWKIAGMIVTCFFYDMLVFIGAGVLDISLAMFEMETWFGMKGI